MTVNACPPRWEQHLVDQVAEAMGGDPYWGRRFAEHQFTIHLAIFVEPFLQYVLDGKKTVESRFSVNRCAPYRRVHPGDAIVLKRSGGPVVAICEVTQAWDYELDLTSWQEIRVQFTNALCAQDPSFWTDRKDASYATLLRIDHVTPLVPLVCAKQDRRGWVVLSLIDQHLILEEAIK